MTWSPLDIGSVTNTSHKSPIDFRRMSESRNQRLLDRNEKARSRRVLGYAISPSAKIMKHLIRLSNRMGWERMQASIVRIHGKRSVTLCLLLNARGYTRFIKYIQNQ